MDSFSVVLVFLSVAGFLLALYATLIFHRLIPAKQIPGFGWCLPDKKTCDIVFHHPDSGLLGVFNGIPAMAYYLLICLTLAGVPIILLPWMVIALAAIAVCVTIFLVYSLFARVKTSCIICMISHVVNILLSVGFIVHGK